MVTPAQLSVAVGFTHVTGTLHMPGDVETVMFDGQLVKTGVSPSVTVIRKEQVVVLPLPSVAVN